MTPLYGRGIKNALEIGLTALWKTCLRCKSRGKGIIFIQIILGMGVTKTIKTSATPQQKLQALLKEKGIKPDAAGVKKSLDELAKFWNEEIGLTYTEVKKRAWR